VNPAQVVFERLDEHRRRTRVPAVARQHVEQTLLERQSDRSKVCRVLRLGVDADGTATRPAKLLRERNDLVESRNVEPAVVIMRPERQPLLRPERLDLGECEILGEPSGHRRAVDDCAPLPIGELLRDVRGPADFVFVPRDKDAVLRRHQIGFDEVRAHLGRQPVGLEGVLGPMTARAAVPDNQNVCGFCRHGSNAAGNRDRRHGQYGDAPQPRSTRIVVRFSPWQVRGSESYWP
jgi:hypothetical protein